MDANSFFKNKKLKVTKARVYIYMLLAKNLDSVTAEYIYDQSKEDGVDINLSTVYRTLEVFEKENIVEKFNLGENSHLYSLVREQHNHVLQCSLCHKKIEVACPMRQIEELVKNQTGFTLTEHNLRLKGICEECAKKKE